MGKITIAVINASTIVADADIEIALVSLQRHITRYFRAGWDMSAVLRFAKDKEYRDQEWLLAILDDWEQARALGYDYMTEHGQPLGRVFAKTAQLSGRHWVVNASQELLDMLADPIINLMAADEIEHSLEPLCA